MPTKNSAATVGIAKKISHPRPRKGAQIFLLIMSQNSPEIAREYAEQENLIQIFEQAETEPQSPAKERFQTWLLKLINESEAQQNELKKAAQ